MTRALHTDDLKRPALVSAEILLGTHAAIRGLAIDLGAICSEHSVDPELLHTPGGYVRHSQATRFLQTIAERAGCDHFGFLVGSYQPALQLGALGTVMRAAPTLGASIEAGLRYHPSYSEGSKHSLSLDSGTARLDRWDRTAYPFASTQMRMLGIVLLYKALKAVAGKSWQPETVTYTFSRPAHSEQMFRFFGCPVVFNHESDSLYFPEHQLSAPLAFTDAKVFSLTKARLERALFDRHLDENTYQRVWHYVHLTMGSKRCSMQGCAQFLGVSARALQRDLNTYGHSFRDVLLKVRMDTARQFLRDSGADMATLSMILGYGEQSAFSRAFRQYTGVSPSRWRETAREVARYLPGDIPGQSPHEV